jgi:aquaglyceroporin related protein
MLLDPGFKMSTGPNSKDFTIETSDDHSGMYGSGPGLKNPDNPIATSDREHRDHLNKAATAVESGPTVRRPSGDQEYLQDSLINGETNGSVRTSPSAAETRRHHAMSNVRTKLGLEAKAPILEGHEVHNYLAWSKVRTTLREPFAEFFGTFIMVLFGDGSVAQVLLSTGQSTAPGGDGFGSYQSISWG